MAREFKDRVQDTTQTTGTGAFALDAATLPGYRTFGSAHTVGCTLDYFVSLGSSWEAGTGVLTTATTLTRTTVNASSNAGNLVNFGAGSKSIFETVGAVTLLNVPIVSSVAPNNSDGAPDGTVYIQTA